MARTNTVALAALLLLSTFKNNLAEAGGYVPTPKTLVKQDSIVVYNPRAQAKPLTPPVLNQAQLPPQPMPEFLQALLAYINKNPEQPIFDHGIDLTFSTIDGKQIRVISDFEDRDLNKKISHNEIYNLEVFDIKKPDQGEQYQVAELTSENKLQTQLLYFLANKIESNYQPTDDIYSFKQYKTDLQNKHTP